MKNIIVPHLHSRFFSGSFLYLSIALLTACGGTGQDDASSNATQQSQIVGGLAIDGYIARATVYLDTNNDKNRNAWEPFAFTDNQGYFSYNPITDTNYCASDAPSEQAQYCLVGTQLRNNVVIRIDSGYDLSTGEPFLGQMSARISNQQDNSNISTNISPLTSLFTDVDTQQQDTLLTVLGITEDDLQTNYLNIDNAGTADAGLVNQAIKIHKTVTVLSDRLTDTYNEIGEEIGTPFDATGEIYKQLANELITHTMPLDDALSQSTLIATVLDNSEEVLREIYNRRQLDLPVDMGTTTEFRDFERIIAIANDLPAVVNSLINTNDQEITANQFVGEIKTIESIVLKAVREGATDPTIDNAINFITNPDNEALVGAITTTLQDPNSPVSVLANNDFAGNDFDSPEEITALLEADKNLSPFLNIGGNTLKISNLNLGTSPNNLDDFEAEFYFQGDTTAQAGAFQACIKFIDDVSNSGNIGSTNTRGNLVSGFWSLLQPNATGESFNVLLTIDFLGSTYQTVLKSAPPETIGITDYSVVQTDTTGDITKWHSIEGFTTTGLTPMNNHQCEEKLPSRIGI